MSTQQHTQQRSVPSRRARRRHPAAALLAPAVVAVTGALASVPAFAAPAATPSASATTTGSSSSTPGAAPASAAGTWLAGQLQHGQYLVNPTTHAPDVSYTANAVIGLAASGAAPDTARTADAWLQQQAPKVTSAGQLATMLLAAEAMGDDVHSYGQLDLPKRLVAQLTAKGADLGNPYADSLAVVALHRSGTALPAALVPALLKQQQGDGEFFFTGTGKYPNSPDPDSTGAAIVALGDVSGNAAATSARARAIAWASSHTTAPGYWTSFSPVNTTALVGSALQQAGHDATPARTWMAAQQQHAGGSGLPATLNGTAPDAYATAQGLLLLSGTSYDTVARAGGDVAACTSGGGVYIYTGSASSGGCATTKGTSMQALQAVAKVATDASGMVCRINQTPASCPATADVHNFWHYWWWTGSAWTFASLGPAAHHPAAGSIEAWTLGGDDRPTWTPTSGTSSTPSGGASATPGASASASGTASAMPASDHASKKHHSNGLLYGAILLVACAIGIVVGVRRSR